MPEHTTVFITDSTPGTGTRTYTESGKKTSINVDGLTADTQYEANAEYEDANGNVIQTSQGYLFRTLPAGSFSIFNPSWRNDNDEQHSTFTFDYTSTYALSYAQVVDMATGVTYQGTISGNTVTAQLPAGTVGTQHNFQLIIADIYGYSYVQGYVMTLEASMAETPFYIEAENPSDAPQISLTKTGTPASLTMQISYNKSTWTNYTIGDSIELNEEHPRVYFKNSGDTKFSTGTSNYYKFTADDYVNAGGNIASLKDGSMVNSTSNSYDFYYLFYQNTYLRKSDELYLGNYISLASHCYRSMFNGCTGLTKTPDLPATSMSTYSYRSMFQDCSSITKTPTVRITTLLDAGSSIMAGMFYGCSSLTEATFDINFTDAPNSGFVGMFQNCTSLTKAPNILSTSATIYSFKEMFRGCTSLATPPIINVTSVINPGYEKDPFAYMFADCSSLREIPRFRITDIPTWTMTNTFRNCTSLRSVDLSYVTSTGSGAFYYLFDGCTSLSEIILDHHVPASSASNPYNISTNWVRNVAPSGNFYRNRNVSKRISINSPSGIPTGWTVIPGFVSIDKIVLNSDDSSIEFDFILTDETLASSSVVVDNVSYTPTITGNQGVANINNIPSDPLTPIDVTVTITTTNNITETKHVTLYNVNDNNKCDIDSVCIEMISPSTDHGQPFIQQMYGQGGTSFEYSFDNTNWRSGYVSSEDGHTTFTFYLTATSPRVYLRNIRGAANEFISVTYINGSYSISGSGLKVMGVTPPSAWLNAFRDTSLLC